MVNENQVERIAAAVVRRARAVLHAMIEHEEHNSREPHLLRAALAALPAEEPWRGMGTTSPTVPLHMRIGEPMVGGYACATHQLMGEGRCPECFPPDAFTSKDHGIAQREALPPLPEPAVESAAATRVAKTVRANDAQALRAVLDARDAEIERLRVEHEYALARQRTAIVEMLEAAQADHEARSNPVTVHTLRELVHRIERKEDER